MAFSLDADVLNVSRGGLAVRTSFQLRVGRRYQIQIGEKSDAFQTNGTVRRCRLKGTRRSEETGDVEPVYETGIEFDEARGDSLRELLPIMARTASIQLAPRLFGRLVAETDSAVTLTSDMDFEVKKISLSGLLVETEVLPWSGESVELEIQLGDESFTCAGRVVNSVEVRSGDGERRSQHGIEFVDPDEENLRLLETYLLGQLEKDL